LTFDGTLISDMRLDTLGLQIVKLQSISWRCVGKPTFFDARSVQTLWLISGVAKKTSESLAQSGAFFCRMGHW
jgi:hypothetical protein